MTLYPANSYYDRTKFTDTYFVVFMEIERYFGRELFKNDLTRIFYSSTEFAFRERLNRLAKTQTTNLQDYQFPFACYVRQNQWELDPRLGINSGMAYGGTNIGIDVEINENTVIPNVRFIQVIQTFNMTVFYNNDSDMQIGYEILLWIKRLTPKQWSSNSLEYGGARVDIPIVLQIDSISVNPNVYNEAEWLKTQRIFPIDVQFAIKTMVFYQVAQGTTSTLFKTAEQTAGPSLYIAKEVIYDFLTYKGENIFASDNNIEMTVTGTFSPDPSVSITVQTEDVLETSATLKWSITIANEDPDYVETAYIILNTDPENTIEVEASEKEYVLTNLSPATDYTVKIMFETKNSTFVIKYVNFTTTGTKENIKGIIGLKF